MGLETVTHRVGGDLRQVNSYSLAHHRAPDSLGLISLPAAAKRGLGSGLLIAYKIKQAHLVLVHVKRLKITNRLLKINIL